jgi:hypothetical protein
MARIGHTFTSKAVVAIDGDPPCPLTPEPEEPFAANSIAIPGCAVRLKSTLGL